VLLSLFHDTPDSAHYAEMFEKERTLERLKALDSRARRKGLGALDPDRNELIGIGMELDAAGTVKKNCYGVFNLVWQAQQHPEWAEHVMRELGEIRERIRATHKLSLRFLIWTGMGGSAEDKSMYNAVGLLRRGPRCYVLDSTDPAKLKHILQDLTARSGLKLDAALRCTLVVGMAMGMTSYEPVVNLERLAFLYDKHRIDSRPNFVYMTIPGSLLERFAVRRGYRNIALQLDNANTTAGRHSAPLTRGSLYPLGLAGADLRAWIESTLLTTEEIRTAWRLSAFLEAQGSVGRDKVTLLLPKHWSGAALWTKQDFEESLGKSEQAGIKIVIGERVRMANYHAPKDARQDRVFLAIQAKGAGGGESERAPLLRRAGYPLAAVTFERGARLSQYMQFVHWVVFGVARLRKMNFVTQPGVELYKMITERLHLEATRAGGIEHTAEWRTMHTSPRVSRWRGRVTLHYDRLDMPAEERSAPELYAEFLRVFSASRRVEYGELTFFGDMRVSPAGKAVRKVLDRAGEEVFRHRLKMPVDVYEGPAMNHSYHEMIIGHGKCFSTILISEKSDFLREAAYTADYHRAQFLATLIALAERGRPVVALGLKDLEEASVVALGDFFHEVAKQLKR
jgi:glucose-6-phosphate isomerase